MFENNKIVRRLAWILCLSLIVGLVPVGIWGIPTVNAAPEGTVVFSENVEASNFWSKWSKVGSLFAWTDPDYKYEGNRVLLVQAGGSATGPAFAVTPGKAYSLSYYTKLHTAPAGSADLGSVQIRFYDANSTLIKGATVSAVAWDEAAWAEKTLVAVAPDNAVSARLHFDTDGDPKLTYVVDAMTVTERDPEPDETVATEPGGDSQPSSNLLENGGFEDGFRYWKCSTELSVSDDKFSGAKAAQIVDGSNKSSVTVTQNVPVVPGKTYKLTAKVKFVSGKGGYIGVCNIGGASQYPTIDQSGAWADFSMTVTIPAGYTSATVEMGGFVGTVTTFLVDDVVFEEVVEGEPDPTEATTEATEATETPEGNPVLNPGFENGLKNWTVIGNGTLTDEAHSGSAAVKYVDDTKTGSGYIAQKIAVVPGKSYKVTAWIKHISGDNGYVGICGIGDASVYTSTGKNAQWTQVSAVVTIPEGYTVATVEIGANRSPVVTFLIDDVVVEEVTADTPEQTEPSTEATEATTEATVPGGTLIFQERFEESYTPEGRPASVKIPNGWTASEHTAAVACGKYDKGYDGSYNLCLFNPTQTDRWIRSALQEVVPGYEYTVTFYERKYYENNPGEGGYAKVVFLDVSGNVLKEYEIEAGTSKVWSQMVLYSKAPKNAVSFYFEIGMRKPNGDVNYCVDDVAIYEIEASLSDPDVTNPTEPTVPFDPMKPIDEKFENFRDWNDANAGPEDWISNDDNGSDYAPMIGLVNNSLSVDGYYLRLQKAGKWSIQTPTFPVEIGYEYTASFLARKLKDNDNFAGALQINFVNSRGKVIASEKITVGKTYGAWAEESLSAVAPVGAMKAYLVFTLEYTNGRIEGDYAIDNFTVTRSEEQVFAYTPDPDSMEPTEFDTIYTERFEKYYNPAGSAASVKVPVDWTLSEFTAAIGNAKYDNYDGTFNLVVQGKRDMWAKSPMVAASEGNYYFATFVEKKLYGYREGSGGYGKVVFLDANDKVLKEYREVIGTSEQWTDMEIGGQAPAGTAKLYVEFGLVSAKGDPIYSIDNLEILEGKANLPGSDPGTTKPTEPADPDNNAPTGDTAILVTASAVMVAAVMVAVLILKRKKLF